MDAIDIGGIVIGLALVVIGALRLLHRYYMKRRCASQVAGTILGVDITEKLNDDSPSSPTFYVKYKYLADGAEYAKKRMISKGQYRAIGKHDDFTVFYDPSKPKRHYVLEIKFRMALTLGLIAIGAVLLWAFLVIS